jgi:hypothetical protein
VCDSALGGGVLVLVGGGCLVLVVVRCSDDDFDVVSVHQ